MRLRNQRMLTHRVDLSGSNGGGKGSAEAVESRNPFRSVKLSSWREILESSLTVFSSLSACSSWYDSTTKAVRTAENRPACGAIS